MITWGCTTTYIRDSQNPWTGNPEKKPTIRRNFMQDDIRIWCGDCFKAGLSFLVSCVVMFFIFIFFPGLIHLDTVLWYDTVLFTPFVQFRQCLLRRYKGRYQGDFDFAHGKLLNVGNRMEESKDGDTQRNPEPVLRAPFCKLHRTEAATLGVLNWKKWTFKPQIINGISLDKTSLTSQLISLFSWGWSNETGFHIHYRHIST